MAWGLQTAPLRGKIMTLKSFLLTIGFRAIRLPQKQILERGSRRIRPKITQVLARRWTGRRVRKGQMPSAA
ncbi:MAG: hypothetical protein A2603_03300 [Bdellovibrionales bacterium RIFOXYD1_FULL_55_31]|nr:MAG: hypothetical protein A2603_03300 [Bdellovibrionales bacterium RIFOXYD1_FULL_55_31]